MQLRDNYKVAHISSAATTQVDIVVAIDKET